MLPSYLPAPGVIVGKVDLYPVVHDPQPDGVLLVNESLDFDEPRNNAEYVRGLGFLFNGEALASLRVA